jgi:hypothetical protein
MKKYLSSIAVMFYVIASQSGAQDLAENQTDQLKEGLNVSSKSSSFSFQEQEPGCTCESPELILDLGGKLKLNYKEVSISTLDDGSILVQDRNTNKYYILKAGVTSGPYEAGDPKLEGFANGYMDNEDIDDLLSRYKGIVNKSGEKFLITFKGKNYGPFTEIHDFTVSMSGDKFAVIAFEKEGEMPKLLTNIPNVTLDIFNSQNSYMCGNIKYDDILLFTEGKVVTLQGKTLFTLPQGQMYGCGEFFISTDNASYAYWDYADLTFSDNKSLQNLFNPHLLKIGGTIYLAYMYYSPKRNAIMQCKIPF